MPLVTFSLHFYFQSWRNVSSVALTACVNKPREIPRVRKKTNKLTCKPNNARPSRYSNYCDTERQNQCIVFIILEEIHKVTYLECRFSTGHRSHSVNTKLSSVASIVCYANAWKAILQLLWLLWLYTRDSQRMKGKLRNLTTVWLTPFSRFKSNGGRSFCCHSLYFLDYCTQNVNLKLFKKKKKKMYCFSKKNNVCISF